MDMQISSQTRTETSRHPRLRKLFFALAIVVFIVIFLFLVYQNGKSIYVNGI